MSVRKLTSVDIKNWYKYLNIVRMQSGIGLSSISEGAYTKKQTSTRAQALVNNILTTRNSNTFLKVSDYGVTSSNISNGKKIKYDDREDIEDALISLLRICVNQDCATVCTNSGTNSNQKNSNGDCSNTKKSNGAIYTSDSNGVNSNTTKSNGNKNNSANSNGSNKAGVCKNGTCTNGAKTSSNENACGKADWMAGMNNGTNGNGTCSHGTKGNGTNSKGNHSNGTNYNGGMGNGSNEDYMGVPYDHNNGTNTDGVNNNGVNNNSYGSKMTNGICPEKSSINQCQYGVKANKSCNNGFHSNGYVSTNGKNAHGFVEEVVEQVVSLYSYSNGYEDGAITSGKNSNAWKTGGGSNTNTYHSKGYCTNGKVQTGTNSKGTYTHGTNTQGTKSNGCQHQIYKAGTATYAHKDHYSKEEAKKRAGSLYVDGSDIDGSVDTDIKS